MTDVDSLVPPVNAITRQWQLDALRTRKRTDMPMLQTYKVSVTVECEVTGGGETPTDFIAPVTEAVREALRPNQVDTRFGNMSLRSAVVTEVHARKGA